MKTHALGKIISTFIFLSLPCHAAAQSQTPDCGSINIDSLDNYFLRYRTATVFPELPKRVEIQFIPNKPIAAMSFCGYSISFDGNKLQINSKSVDDLLKITSQNEYFLYVPQSNLTLRTYLKVNVKSRVVSDPYFTGSSISDLVVVAVRIDDGPLKKLIYKKEQTPIIFSDSSKLLNIYAGHTDPKFIKVARMEVDFVKASWSIWYKYDFPKK